MDEESLNFSVQRSTMVMAQLKERGIHDKSVLNAMNIVPREAFVSEAYKEYAYKDGPLPLPLQQTISQPYIVALMASLLCPKKEFRVLEIGTGSGYAAAVLSRIVDEVYTVERYKKLVDYARACLDKLGYTNVCLKHGDGTLGWPQYAPYDGIVVAAGGPAIPETLKQQLAIGGRLVIPIGRDRNRQHLVRVTRLRATEYEEEYFGAVAFVPLIGREGWPKQGRRHSTEA